MLTPEQLELLIQEGEGLAVEFKERFTERIDQDIVAFANTKGGVVLLGVRDDRTVAGETLTNDLKARIQSLAQNCSPSFNFSISQIQDVVIVEVAQGDEKPYSYSSGFYRRLDGATQKMTPTELRIMFREHDEIPFEEKFHPEVTWDDLDTVKINNFVKEADIEMKKVVPRDLLLSLNLAAGDYITNAGVLFFINEVRRFILQAQMTLIAFKGKDRVHIFDRQDVADDLVTQFNGAVLFLKKHLNQ